MTVPNVEPAAEQQQQQEYNKRDYRKKSSITKHKRGGGNNSSQGRYRDELSRYSSYKEVPRYTVPSYVYYYPPSVYYPPSSFDTTNTTTTRDDEDLEIIMHEENMNITSSVDTRRSSDQAPLDLKKQLEFYFSRQNLVNDTYLVSQMDSDLYVPISLVANFRRVREWTTDMDTIVRTLRDSTAVIVDQSGTKVKPNISVQRNTVIWRDVPECTEQEINDLLKELNSPPVQSIKQDIGNMWYFTFESEDDALKLLLSVRGKSFKGQAIAARMKSEPLIRAQTRQSAATNVPSSNVTKAPEAAFPLIPETMFPYRYAYPTIDYRNTYQHHTNRQNNYQTRQPSSPTRAYNYHGGNKNSYEKSQQRSGYKPKHHYNNRNERPESEPVLETSLANVSISESQQQNHYQSRQHYNQPRHYHNNKYNKNKVPNAQASRKYQTHPHHHHTTTSTTTTTNENKNQTETSSTPTIKVETALYQSTKQTGQNTMYKSKKKTNGGHYNNNSNEGNHGSSGGDKHNIRKKKKNTLVLNNEDNNGSDFKVELKPTHFPPLPNHAEAKLSNDTIISNSSESSVSTAPPTRSAADIVKANAKAPLKKKQTVSNMTKKPDQDENSPVTDAFPSLCQTNEFKSTPFSYADMLKKKEEKQ